MQVSSIVNHFFSLNYKIFFSLEILYNKFVISIKTKRLSNSSKTDVYENVERILIVFVFVFVHMRILTWTLSDELLLPSERNVPQNATFKFGIRDIASVYTSQMHSSIRHRWIQFGYELLQSTKITRKYNYIYSVFFFSSSLRLRVMNWFRRMDKKSNNFCFIQLQMKWSQFLGWTGIGVRKIVGTKEVLQIFDCVNDQLCNWFIWLGMVFNVYLILNIFIKIDLGIYKHIYFWNCEDILSLHCWHRSHFLFIVCVFCCCFSVVMLLMSW